MKTSIISAIATSIPIALIFDFLFGDITPLFYVLLVCIAIDILSGLSKAIYIKDLKSREFIRGGIRKGMIFLVIILANMIDITLFDNTPIVKTATILYFISMEGISLIENLDAMDIKLPSFLNKYLVSMKDKSDSIINNSLDDESNKDEDIEKDNK